MYFVVNTFYTTLFSHVVIGIDHGRSGVDLLSGGDVPRAALSGRPGAGQQINSRPTVINPLNIKATIS